MPKSGSGNGPCSGAEASASKHAILPNPPWGSKGMEKSPEGGVMKVFSSVLEDMSNSFNTMSTEIL